VDSWGGLLPRSFLTQWALRARCRATSNPLPEGSFGGTLRGMEDLLTQIEAGADAPGLYFLTLAGALIVPDICGAVDANNGEATRESYRDWFDKWLGPKYRRRDMVFLDGADCYRFRCSFLHQGRTDHPMSSVTRIAFFEPGSSEVVFHQTLFNGYLFIDVQIFVRDIVMAAREWLGERQGTEPFETNLATCVKRHVGYYEPLSMVGPVVIA
jgi:hypothetical protein